MKRWKYSSVLLMMLIACAVLGGCGPLFGGARADKEFFVLNDDGYTPKALSSLDPLVLLVRDTKANRFVNSHKIIFAEAPEKRGYYQFAQWVEPPTDRVTLLIVERFERVGVFRSVSRIASSTLGDFQLNTEILEFYHDISRTPGFVRITLSAELVNLVDRKEVVQKKFTCDVPVEVYNAEGAVRAFTIGTNRLLNELVSWTADAAAATH
jgi:ABC-type uncharacterized transport system auxiliary subunit